jgi:hypothetical protein
MTVFLQGHILGNLLSTGLEGIETTVNDTSYDLSTVLPMNISIVEQYTVDVILATSSLNITSIGNKYFLLNFLKSICNIGRQETIEYILISFLLVIIYIKYHNLATIF